MASAQHSPERIKTHLKRYCPNCSVRIRRTTRRCPTCRTYTLHLSDKIVALLLIAFVAVVLLFLFARTL